MLQHGQTETDGQPPVSIKTSIHQLLRLIFPSHTRPSVFILFFTCLRKATHSKLDEALSFEVQKCRALVCSALLPDCVSTQHQTDSTPFWYYCLFDLSLSVSLSLFSPMSFH